MNIFGERSEKEKELKWHCCPVCNSKYTSFVAVGKNWVEYCCCECRRVFVEKDTGIEVKGVMK